jgi:LysM repeat protein
MPQGFTYKVRRGETPTTIAQRYGITPEQILRANPGGAPFSVGQTVRIPGSPVGLPRVNAPNLSAPTYGPRETSFLGNRISSGVSSAIGTIGDFISSGQTKKQYQYAVNQKTANQQYQYGVSPQASKPPLSRGVEGGLLGGANTSRGTMLGGSSRVPMGETVIASKLLNWKNTLGSLSVWGAQRLAALAGVTQQDVSSGLRSEGFVFNPVTGNWTNPVIQSAAQQNGDSGNLGANWSREGSSFVTPTTMNSKGVQERAVIRGGIRGNKWEVVTQKNDQGVWERVTRSARRGRGGGGGGGGGGGSSSGSGTIGTDGASRPGSWSV